MQGRNGGGTLPEIPPGSPAGKREKSPWDAACGEGYGSSLLAEEAEEVTGLDIDKEAVENANHKYGNKKLSYLKGSIEELPFEDHTLDVVVSFETIEHVGEEIQKKFLEEICRVLKPEGTLIMSTPNKAVYTDLVEGENPFHVKEFLCKRISGNFWEAGSPIWNITASIPIWDIS